MIKLKNITKFLNQNFPEKNAETWDKVGLISGSFEQPINNVLISLDLTLEVLNQAVKNRCELIIVHHPFWFEKTKIDDLKQAPYKKELFKRLINNSIALYVMHTNYDNNKIGTTYQLMQLLNFNKFIFLKNNYYVGIGEKLSDFKELSNLIKEKTGISKFETNFDYESKITVNKIAFLPGAGSPELIYQAHQAGAGLIFTSDVKWSTWLMAKAHSIKLINYSHEVETVFIHHIKKFLTEKFKHLNIFGEIIKQDNHCYNIKKTKGDNI